MAELEATVKATVDKVLDAILNRKAGLAIVSAGHGSATQVIDLATGKRVENISRAEWQVDATGFGSAILYIHDVPILALADEDNVARGGA